MAEKTEGEILKEKLFNKKENGWVLKNQEERNTIMEYAKASAPIKGKKFPKSCSPRIDIISDSAVIVNPSTNQSKDPYPF